MTTRCDTCACWGGGRDTWGRCTVGKSDTRWDFCCGLWVKKVGGAQGTGTAPAVRAGHFYCNACGNPLVAGGAQVCGICGVGFFIP